MNKLFLAFTLPDLRKRFLFVCLILFLYRLGGYVPIPGVDLNQVRALFDQGGLLGFVNLFSGGGLSRFSLFALGIIPFINASIIMQLMTVVSPSLKELAQEGDVGRKKVSQYTRYLAVVLALVQAIVVSVTFKGFLFAHVSTVTFFVYALIGLVAGATLVMWFGELITERGIGNGASLIIFIGIVAQMPVYIKNTVVFVQGGGSVVGIVALILILIAVIAGIVFVQEAQRNIPVQYAKRVVGRRMMGAQSTYIPLKLIQGGVLPIIFASAVLQFPIMIMGYIPNEAFQSIVSTWYRYDGFVYNALFCILIFFFTYFYTAITFNPVELSDSLKKHGGFVIGVRPGKPTVDYLEGIITRLTFFGAVFLSLIAIVPVVGIHITRVNSFAGLGGTALLIIVGVALDLVKHVDTYIMNHQYKGFLN